MTDIDRERAAEDLRVVRVMMESCARRQQDTGIYFIIWGLLIPPATGINYLLVHLEKWNGLGLLWGGVGLLGCALTILLSLKRQRYIQHTHGARVQGIVWIGSWVSIILMIGGGLISKDMSINMTMAVLAFMLATAIFVSGFLSGTVMLKYIAVGWWVTGIICIFTHAYDASIVIAVATFFLFFIPGIILDQRSREFKKNEEMR